MHQYLATVVFVCFCSMHYVKILPLCTMLRHTMVAMMSGGLPWSVMDHLLHFCLFHCWFRISSDIVIVTTLIFDHLTYVTVYGG